MRGLEPRAGEEFFGPIVVEPPLTRLEARDDRVTRSGVMFRCMLVRRTIAAADVTAFGASAKMKPPSAQSRAFDATCSAWLGRRVDAIPLRLHRLLCDFFASAARPADQKGARCDSLHRTAFRPDCRARCRSGLSRAKQVCGAATIRPPPPTAAADVSCRLAVSDARIALPNFDNIAIGVANVAACLAVFGLRLGQEFGSSLSP